MDFYTHRVFHSLLGILFVFSLVHCEGSKNTSDQKAVRILVIPTHLFADRTQEGVRLIWTDPNPADNGHVITVYRNQEAGVYINIGETSAGTFLDSQPLVENVTYHYLVRAKIGVDLSPESNVVPLKLEITQPPPPPTALQASAVSGSQIRLQWVDNSQNETGFRVERSVDNSEYLIVDTVAPNILEYRDVALTPDTSYFYRVTAFIRANNRLFVASSESIQTRTLSFVPSPNVPTEFKGTALSPGEIKLEWKDMSLNEDGFVIESLSNEGSFEAIHGILGPNTTTYNHKGLESDKEYTYRIRAFAGPQSLRQYSAYSDSLTIRTHISRPPEITLTKAISTYEDNENRVTLTWESRSASQIKIQRKTAQTALIEIGSVSGEITSYVDKTVSEEVPYTYQIFAINEVGSIPSNEVGAVVQTAPQALQATAISRTQINLNWLDSSAFNDGCIIERSENGQDFTAIKTLQDPIATQYSDTGLVSDKVYTYRIRNVRAGENYSRYSGVVSSQTLPNPPAVPTNVIATAQSASAIRVSWDHDGAHTSKFKIIRNDSSGVQTPLPEVTDPTVRYVVDTGLTESTTYVYVVQAIGLGGESSLSAIAEATTFGTSRPGAPSDLVATANDYNRVTLTWRDNSTSEAQFDLWRKKSSEPESAFAKLAIAIPADATSAVDATSTLVENTSYDYKLQPCNSGGCAGFSDVVSVTTLYKKPTAPSSLTAAVKSQSQIDLIWSDISSNETGFRIYRTRDRITYSPIVERAANIETYSDTTLEANTQYTYKVTAFRYTRESDPSNTITKTTWPNPPEAPTNFVATATSSTSIKLNWTDNSTTETGFEIFQNTGTTPIKTLSANSTESSVTSGISAGATYTFKIVAVNGTVRAAPVTSNSVTILAAPTTLTSSVPSPGGHKQINVNWAYSSTIQNGFILERSTSSTTGFASIAWIGATLRSYVDNENVLSNTTYYYRLRASNDSGQSSPSSTTSKTTLMTPPGEPRDLKPTGRTATSIALAWIANSSNAEGFRVERSDNCQNYSTVATLNSSTITYNDSTVASSKKYCYKVKAYTQSGEIESNIASDTTLSQ